MFRITETTSNADVPMDPVEPKIDIYFTMKKPPKLFEYFNKPI